MLPHVAILHNRTICLIFEFIIIKFFKIKLIARTNINNNNNKKIRKKVRKRVNKILSNRVVPASVLKNQIRRRVVRAARIPKALNAPNAISALNRRPKRIAGPPMSPAGFAFLKCAFAPPDFANTGVQGIPDSFRGTSLVKKHRFTTTLTTLALNDYYILVLPVPGISMFLGAVATGTPILSSTIFNGVNYPDFTSIFPSFNAVSQNFTSFRFISNHFELISTTNEFSWTGQITAWKFPLKMIVRQGGASVSDLWSVDGIESLNAAQGIMYSGKTKDGIYIACYNDDADFDFTTITDGVGAVPAAIAGDDFGQLNTTVCFPGFDNRFQCAVIKISGASGNNTFIMKHWACVEYKVNTNSSLYEYQTLSPCEDEKALKVYRELINSLPIAVPAAENANFWQRVLSIIRTISGVGALIPGPYGMISSGVNTITGALTELTM